MMKTFRGVIISVLLLLILGQSCAFQILTSIQNLIQVYSSRNDLPTHSLTLMHWFANTVNIDNNNVVRVTFGPNGDFGSHHYGNYERLLPSAPQGNQYYTVGNLIQQTCPVFQTLPRYVREPRVQDFASMRPNRDRIIFQIDNSRRVHEMFLTQHFQANSQGSRYDPNHTFELTPNLLQDLRQFTFSNNRPSLQTLRDQYNQNINNNQLNDLMTVWGRNQAPLGLLHFTVVPHRLMGACGRNVHPPVPNGRRKRGLPLEIPVESESPVSFIPQKLSLFHNWGLNCEFQSMHLEVVTGDNGKARIVWRDVPSDILNNGAAVALFNGQTDQEQSLTYQKIEDTDGSWDTPVNLNEGFQARLHRVERSFFSWTLKEEHCRGNTFESPPAVPVTKYAQLQLYVSDGKACFRFYVRAGCDQWQSDLAGAWAALYESAEEGTNDYLFWQWQYVNNFEKRQDIGENDIFIYCTGTTVKSGLEARFILNKEERARISWP